MSFPYLGEIRLLSFNFAPKGWAVCNGQLLPINQNQALFAILGTSYGGNGQTTFALPNLQGRVPIHMGTGIGGTPYSLGQAGGEYTHSLTTGELPSHAHTLNASTRPQQTNRVAGALPAVGGVYEAPPAGDAQPMASGAVASTGGSQPHDNMQPLLVLEFCIALQGIFPSRN